MDDFDIAIIEEVCYSPGSQVKLEEAIESRIKDLKEHGEITYLTPLSVHVDRENQKVTGAVMVRVTPR